LLAGRPAVEVRIEDAASGRPLWRRYVPPGTVLELRYVHSVERTPVVEVFRAEVRGLYLVEMRFTSQGAGLPTEGYVRERDFLVLRTDRHVGTLHLRVSALARHRLRVHEQDVDLTALVGDGAWLAVGSRRGPLRLRRPGARPDGLWYNLLDSAGPPWPKRQATR
jgi:hypothetical protein